MDANKLKVLREIDYRIPMTCALCVHSVFSTRHSEFGTCDAHQYDHLKHTDNPRQLSVYHLGTCPKAERPNPEDLSIGGFNEFVKESDA